MPIKLKIGSSDFARETCSNTTVVHDFFAADAHTMMSDVHRTLDVKVRRQDAFLVKLAVSNPACNPRRFLQSREAHEGIRAVVVGGQQSHVDFVRKANKEV